MWDNSTGWNHIAAEMKKVSHAKLRWRADEAGYSSSQLMRSAATSHYNMQQQWKQPKSHNGHRKHENEAIFSSNEKVDRKWKHEDSLEPRSVTYGGLRSLKSGRNQALYWKQRQSPTVSMINTSAFYHGVTLYNAHSSGFRGETEHVDGTIPHLSSMSSCFSFSEALNKRVTRTLKL